MYAIIKTGGKQYRVNVGDTLKVELLGQDAGSQVRPPRQGPHLQVPSS